MEQQQQRGGKEDQNDQQKNANNAESKKLSDYPEGNLDEVKSQTDSIPGNQTDQPSTDDDASE